MLRAHDSCYDGDSSCLLVPGGAVAWTEKELLFFFVFFFSCGESVLSLGIRTSSPTEPRALGMFIPESFSGSWEWE